MKKKSIIHYNVICVKKNSTVHIDVEDFFYCDKDHVDTARPPVLVAI